MERGRRDGGGGHGGRWEGGGGGETTVIQKTSRFRQSVYKLLQLQSTTLWRNLAMFKALFHQSNGTADKIKPK